jgi:hypothetical protein
MPVTGNFSVELDPSQMADWDMLTDQDQRGVLAKVMGWYMNKQRSNVRRGVDIHGRRFLPLSREYRDLKRRGGRLASGHWLRLSGDMFRSQKTIIKKRGRSMIATIEFAGTRPQYQFKKRKRGGKGGDMRLHRTGKKVSSALVAAANDRLRPFVGVSPKSLNAMTKLFARELDKLSRRRG